METTEIALEASETGHLVLSTLHTTDASKTVNRIIGIYPKSEEHVIRTRLAQAFRYIVSQRLLPRANGEGRVAAVEILKSTPRSREYIEQGESEGKTLLEAMNDGELEGMQHFDLVIERLIRSGVITQETGLAFRHQSVEFVVATVGARHLGRYVEPARRAPVQARPRRRGCETARRLESL